MNNDIQGKISILEQSLGLSHPPIGMAFVDGPPTGVGGADTSVPSACSFWRMAEQGVFYASEEEHFNCPIGVMTMGFQIPTERQAEAEAIIGTMCELEYITPEEANSIPSVPNGHNGIVYGPIGQMPVESDVVLFLCKPSKAMLLAEASGSVDWKGQGMAAFGRPTCAAIPMALQSLNASASMGCVGFRVYTGIPDEEMLIAVPSRQLPTLVERLGTIVSANSALEDFHTQRGAQI